MLKENSPKKLNGKNRRFAIVASSYNSVYVDSMLQGALDCLHEAGAKKTRVVRVPGAFEIPVVAARLARLRRPRLDAVICLGVILRGETTHAEHIGTCVSQALTDIQVREGVPMIHEVLLLESPQQAEKRCLNPKHNRGQEAAQTALIMAQVMQSLG